MSYIPNATVVKGGQTKNTVTDEDSQQLLQMVLNELKVMNIHLAVVTDNFITTEEV
jgi:hypothetical protein